MKIELLLIFLVSLWLPTFGQRQVNCSYFLVVRNHQCIFRGVNLDPNERIIIRVQPEAAEENITLVNDVQFTTSSIFSPPPELFSKFPSLTTLNVRTQRIQDVPAGTFTFARSLQILHLASNRIHNDYLNNVFRGASSMVWLNLHNCSLREINVDAFRGLFSKI